MLLTTLICCTLSVALLCHYLFVGQRKLIAGPESFFLLMGTGSFVATLLAAGEAGDYSHRYVAFIGTGLVVFILGTAASTFLLRFSHRKALRTFVAKPWVDDLSGLQFHTLLTIGFVSVAVTVAYFYLLGFFVPAEAFLALLTNGTDGMSAVYNSLRRNTSATGNYLAPGYIYQFKHCLLPLVTIILFFRMQIRSRLADRLLFGLFLVLTALAAVGTGSRFAFAFFAVAFIIIGLSSYMAPYRLTKLQTLAVSVLGLLALSALTLMMGARGQAKLIDHPLLWAPLQVLDRVFSSPSRERFAVYELFLRDLEPQWGRGSLAELEILLPGRQEYSLSNQLHELLYGSATGNVGLDIWGSLWYDFQWFGLIVVFLFGFLCNCFYVRLLRGPKRHMRVLTLAYAGLILGLATDLQVLILHGFVTCLLFLFVIKCARNVESVLLESRSHRLLTTNGRRPT